jgi:hypothetical protein
MQLPRRIILPQGLAEYQVLKACGRATDWSATMIVWSATMIVWSATMIVWSATIPIVAIFGGRGREDREVRRLRTPGALNRPLQTAGV